MPDRQRYGVDVSATLPGMAFMPVVNVVVAPVV